MLVENTSDTITLPHLQDRIRQSDFMPQVVTSPGTMGEEEEFYWFTIE